MKFLKMGSKEKRMETFIKNPNDNEYYLLDSDDLVEDMDISSERVHFYGNTVVIPSIDGKRKFIAATTPLYEEDCNSIYRILAERDESVKKELQLLRDEFFLELKLEKEILMRELESLREEVKELRRR